MTHLAFDMPLMLVLGMPLGGALLWWFARKQRQQGRSARQVAVLTALRGAALVALLCLAARPEWVQPVEETAKREQVVLLIDRSESMSLRDGDRSRYAAAVDFTRRELLPKLQAAGLRVVPLLFAEDATVASGQQIVEARPDGKQTNLGRAIVRGLLQLEHPPLAAIALTDGVATEESDTNRALSALVESRVPFVGIGFGRETSTQILSVERVTGPPLAAPNQQFHISARVCARGAGVLPGFDLLLLRDGKLLEKKTVPPASSARDDLQSFPLTEAEPGMHTYTVRLVPPSSPLVKCTATEATTSVRIADEKQLRVLFVQGGLTWDYKFIRLALLGDPTTRLSGLSRTASSSMFFHEVEDSAELVGGFPATAEQLSAFRVVVLSNLKAADLTPSQQDVLVQFCRDQGGGVLLIGGPETFDAAWKGSSLEQLLPVRFATSQPATRESPFRLKLTRDALTHPVFQVTPGNQQQVWDTLPTFTQFARVDSLKPGAWAWAVHPTEHSSRDNRPLMAAQRYGAGLSTVICVQNFWRWRLARETDTEQFDRFWQQLLRFLGEGTRENIAIRFPDQTLRAGGTVRALVEARPARSPQQAGKRTYQFRVTTDDQQPFVQQNLELVAGQSVETTFLAKKPGVYTAAVHDPGGQVLATGVVDIRDVEREFAQTTRNMENLGQWAGLSGGTCWPVEELRDAGDVLNSLQVAVAQPHRTQPVRLPAGVNGWTLGLLLSCLCGEWLLRKKWGLS